MNVATAARSLTILICTHNRADLLARVIDSLESARQPAGWSVRLFVVANACTDGTHDFLEGCTKRSSALPLSCIAEPTVHLLHKTRNCHYRSPRSVAVVLPRWADAATDDGSSVPPVEDRSGRSEVPNAG